MVETIKLKNGVTVVCEKIEAIRSIAFGIWIKNGSKHETRETNGISHFIEHMLFKGTQTRSAKEIANEMDYVGGHINAFTSREYTCYHTRTLDTHFEKALDVMADMFFNSVFSEEEIQKESRVIQEEINMYEDSPEDLVHELISENVFAEHPLSYPIIGTKQTVDSFDSEAMKGYFSTHYTPENTIIAIAGSFEQDALMRLIDSYFGSFSASAAAFEETTPIYTPTVITREKEIEQTHICLTFPGVRHGTEESFALSVFDLIFGGGMSSRLFQKIREEQGLVYSIYSGATGYKQAGIYSIYAGMGADCAQEVIRLIGEEIRLLQTEKIDEETLIKTKEQIKSAYIIGLESTAGRMSGIGRSQLMLGKVRTTDEVLARVDAVTLERIYDLLPQVFNFDKLCAAAVGKVSGLDIPGALMGS